MTGVTALAQEGPVQSDPSSYAVYVEGLVKRYSSRAKALGAPGVHSVSQISNFVSVLTGRSPRNLVALDHVSLSVSPGEVFGILGPNGAGKTTLIKILSTLVIPDEGRAYIDGVDVVRRPRAALKEIQTVLAEGVGFERRLSGRQNLEFYAELYGIPRYVAKERIASLLDMVGLTDKAGLTFNRYSTGMARKLLLCRALLSDASVLVFDEPTSGLDPTAAAEFRRMLKGFISREKHKTVLLASHNLWEVQQICDRVGVLKQGKVVAVGSPAQISEAMEDRVTLTVFGDTESKLDTATLKASIETVAGVRSCILQTGTSSKGLSITIDATKDLDYNSMFEKLMASGLKIRSLESSQPSLEEAFIKLVGEGGSWSFQ